MLPENSKKRKDRVAQRVDPKAEPMSIIFTNFAKGLQQQQQQQQQVLLLPAVTQASQQQQQQQQRDLINSSGQLLTTIHELHAAKMVTDAEKLELKRMVLGGRDDRLLIALEAYRIHKDKADLLDTLRIITQMRKQQTNVLLPLQQEQSQQHQLQLQLQHPAQAFTVPITRERSVKPKEKSRHQHHHQHHHKTAQSLPWQQQQQHHGQQQFHPTPEIQNQPPVSPISVNDEETRSPTTIKDEDQEIHVDRERRQDEDEDQNGNNHDEAQESAKKVTEMGGVSQDEPTNIIITSERIPKKEQKQEKPAGDAADGKKAYKKCKAENNQQEQQQQQQQQQHPTTINHDTPIKSETGWRGVEFGMRRTKP